MNSDVMEMATPTSIPTSYAVTARPARPGRGNPVNPRLVGDLEATLRNGQALTWSTEGMDEKQVVRFAARLNGVGRRAGLDFAVRTRATDGTISAWAVPKPAGVQVRRRRPATTAGEANTAAQ